MVTASPALRAQIAGALGFGPSEPLPVALECDDLNTLVRLSRDTGLLVMLPHQLALQAGRSLRCISVAGSTTPVVAEIHLGRLAGHAA